MLSCICGSYKPLFLGRRNLGRCGAIRPVPRTSPIGFQHVLKDLDVGFMAVGEADMAVSASSVM